VIGTMNGSLIVSSLPKGSTAKAIDMEDSLPHLVAVTSGWGFIVTYAQRVLSGKADDLVIVFNVNGDFVGRIAIDSPVAY